MPAPDDAQAALDAFKRAAKARDKAISTLSNYLATTLARGDDNEGNLPSREVEHPAIDEAKRDYLVDTYRTFADVRAYIAELARHSAEDSRRLSALVAAACDLQADRD